MASLKHQYILVGIETDPTRYHGENACRPALLERISAEQVLECIATDLFEMIPRVCNCTVTMTGALYDQTQLLRPQLPVYAALEKFQHPDDPSTEFQPRLLGIGADDGQMPLWELQPFKEIPLRLFQLLPLLISGPAKLLNEVTGEMASAINKSGQLSNRSVSIIESMFQVSVNRARFMTTTDLTDLLRLQLEHYGFRPLWELLDAALGHSNRTLLVNTPGGLSFKWHEGAVHSYFETFDWWAQYGGGVDMPADGQQLQSAYADWTREYRRYLNTLTAYGVKICQHLPGMEDIELSDSFLQEESTLAPQDHAAPLTEHNIGDLGTIAVTVVNGDRQMNFYPLQAKGLDDLHQFIREQGYSGDTAFPGGIYYTENSRQLLADAMPCGQ